MAYEEARRESFAEADVDAIWTSLKSLNTMRYQILDGTLAVIIDGVARGSIWYDDETESWLWNPKED